MLRPNGQSKAPEVRLVPHSGIQFLRYGLDIASSPKLSREFIGRPNFSKQSADGKVQIDILPGWNEDDPEGDPPFEADASDLPPSRISKERAVETFLNQWIPIPYLAVLPGRDEAEREILDAGPLNWVRVRITPSSEQGRTHTVVIAFDTEIVQPSSMYVGPIPKDVTVEQTFVLASTYRDIARFLKRSQSGAAGEPAVGNVEASPFSWVNAWLKEAWISHREHQTQRHLREEERQTIDHLAAYFVLLEFMALAIPELPRVRLIDTYSEDRRIKPVQVDLVLDVGNSRTCGILIETHPNDRQMSFANTTVLGLRDLGNPSVVYREPFESHVELKQADFGPVKYSHHTRVRAFFWPSPVRTGPEAGRYRDQAEGNEGTSGMSSPKRYLCDVAPLNQEWRFQAADYGASGERPPIDLAVRQFVNTAGDVLRQIDSSSDEKQLYRMLAQSTGYEPKLREMARERKYSRSSMFTFMLTEIVAQTISAINNAQFRAERKDRDAPRELRRIIMSLPTAMPIQEQRIMRSRAQAAVKLLWDLMKWPPNQRPYPAPPEISLSWDEATCTQIVYLYSEIVTKYGGNLQEFFELVGRPRKRVDPEDHENKVSRDELKEEISLRVASIDVGGGTTDLMVTTYYIDDGRSLFPIQNFREGFRIAGDEILREVIQIAVIPTIERALHNAGVVESRALMRDRFGGHDANMTIPEQKLRRQFVLRVFEPAALAILKGAETADPEAESRVGAATLRDLLAPKPTRKPSKTQQQTKEGAAPVIQGRIAAFLEESAQASGAESFHLEDVSIPIAPTDVRNAVHAALGDVFDCLAEAINSLDCDVVILSGRPSRLPATIDLFIDKLAVSPDRVIPLSRFQVGDWYPFSGKSSYRIEDPKTATVVGALLCALVDRKTTNFRVDTRRFNMRSTAKFIGEMREDGRIPDGRVLFKWDNGDPTKSAPLLYHFPTLLGYRQLPLERWIATPLYRLKLNAESAAADRLPAPPYKITLERITEFKDLDLEAKTFAESFAGNEALKEQIHIADVEASAGGGHARNFSLQLETLPSQDGYWLDTGILTVAGA